MEHRQQLFHRGVAVLGALQSDIGGFLDQLSSLASPAGGGAYDGVPAVNRDAAGVQPTALLAQSVHAAEQQHLSSPPVQQQAHSLFQLVQQDLDSLLTELTVLGTEPQPNHHPTWPLSPLDQVLLEAYKLHSMGIDLIREAAATRCARQLAC